MTKARAIAIDAAYRRQLDLIRTKLTAELERAWGDDVDPDDIAATVDAYIGRVTPLIEAGQATAQSLATAYLGAYLAELTGEDFDPLDEDPEIPGTTRDGRPLAAGLAAIGPMVLARIAEGIPLAEALDTGRYLAGRFGDAEVSGAVDRETARQLERAPVTGWEGVVLPDACPRCQEANAGTHSMDEPLYRHPGCNCERRFVTG